MILVRTGGIVGIVVSLLIAAMLLFVVRPAINDTTDRAFDAANRAIDQATIAAGGGDYVSPTRFAAAVTQVRDELGPDAELLDLTVAKQGGGTVTYRTGDRAAGLRWGPGHAGLQAVKVKLIGPGKLADNVFPIAKLDPAASAKLTAAIEATAPGFEAETMALKLDPMTGKPRWTVTGEGKVFTAGPDATSVKKVG